MKLAFYNRKTHIYLFTLNIYMIIEYITRSFIEMFYIWTGNNPPCPIMACVLLILETTTVVQTCKKSWVDIYVCVLVVNDTQSDSIQYLNFAKKWFIQYSIQYCFTQDSIQNIIQLKK